MGILDRFKKNVSEEKAAKGTNISKASLKSGKNNSAKHASDNKKTNLNKAKKSNKQKADDRRRLSGFEYHIIQSPHVTEKGANIASENIYLFRVKKTSSKRQIKVAIQNIFGVRVTGIRTISMAGREKRRARTIGRTSSWKKAYVKIHQDDSIDLYS